MGKRIAPGDKLPFFQYDTPYSAANSFRRLLAEHSPLVLVFMSNFGHPVTRTFVSRYSHTRHELTGGGFAMVVRSHPEKLAANIGPGTLPFPAAVRRRRRFVRAAGHPHPVGVLAHLLAGGLADPEKSAPPGVQRPRRRAPSRCR